MSVSRQEEIIAVLWGIAALIAFGNGYTVWGWVCAINGAVNLVISIWVEVVGIAAKLKRSQNEQR